MDLTIDDITSVIIDESIKLHKRLGPGLLESVYEELLAKALQRRGLFVERQKLIRFEYDGIVFENGLRADLFVERKVLVELKALEQHEGSHVHTPSRTSSRTLDQLRL